MGSRFTIRIPLYGVQNRSPLVIDGLVGKCCWLAIRNTSLALFVESLLTHHGLHAQIYDGQQPGADDIC